MLTPFVRSDTVGAILAEVFLRPDREFTIAELARRTGALPATAHKEISRLVRAGVLVDRREGNNRLVRVDPSHPLHAPMSEIIAATYGPAPVLRDLLLDAPGVLEAFVYGSWAERRSGRPGAFPGDVDVMVIGDLPVDALLEIQEQARQRLGLDVNVYRATADEWGARQGNPFLAEVASRPIAPLRGRDDADAVGA
jgi:predicted nucleotidyltransferase